MALVGEAFLSASVQVMCDKIGSREFRDLFRGKKLDESLVKKLKITLLSLNAVLNDAEEKQFTNTYVKEWLDELQDAVFDADDLLDEINAEVLRCKVEAEYRTVKTQVWNFLSTSLNPFYQGMNGRIQELFDRLEHLAKQKDVLGLREGVVGGKVSQRTPTTSLVDESCVYGRDGDKEKLMNLLLSDEASNNDVSVITVVGMGGVGKTTLAQLLYNDDKVKEHFNLRTWAYVSADFDVTRVTKTLLESVSSKDYYNKDLSFLQVELGQQIKGKKFLFVLDDLWNENYGDLSVLQRPFASGASGSWVIVTTRNESVAARIRTVPIHFLEQLSDEDCWLLLSKHAFENGNSSARLDLEEVGFVRSEVSSPFRTSWLGWLGAAMEDQSSLFCMRGWPSIFFWGGALQIQPPFWSLSHRFSSQMLCSCVAVPATLHPSSHRTGLAQTISRFRKKKEDDLRKKKWSNQYENPQSAHQSGGLLLLWIE